MVRDGRVRGIGITSLQRSPNAPDLPTFNESGFPGFEATSWFALMGPAGLPKPIVDKVRAESLKVLADPEMKQKFADLIDTVGSTGEETRAAIASDIPKWAKVIKDANIKPATEAWISRSAAALDGNAALQRRARLACAFLAVLGGAEPVTVRVGERIAVEKGAQRTPPSA